MSIAYRVPIALGPSKAGLESLLRAKLYDSANVQVGGEISSGFLEWGTNGNYTLLLALPDDWSHGTIKVYEAGDEADCWIDAVNRSSILGDINVDSTGGTLTLAKAVEALVARAVGNMAYDPDTGLWTLYGRDGVTAVATVKLTGGGNRTESDIP